MIDRSKFKPTSLLYVNKEIFNEEISYFQKYVVDVSYHFETRAIELINSFIKTFDELDDRLDEEYKINILEFPKILNGSILITLQTILEKTLKTLLKSCTRKFGLIVRKKRNNESDIGYYKDIFENEVGINFAYSIMIWEKIDKFRSIRNVFVHNGGNIHQVDSQDKKELIENIIKADDRLILNEHTGDILVNDIQYLISYLNAVQEFCNPLFDQLIRKHNQIIKNSK